MSTKQQAFEQLGYDELAEAYNQLYAPKPNEPTMFSQTTMFYNRLLMRHVYSLFDITGCPEEWNVEQIKQILLTRGYIGIGKTIPYGVIPLKGTINGYRINKRPYSLIVAMAPTHGLSINDDFIIGKDCEVIHLQESWTGVMEIIQLISEKLSMIDSGIQVNIINTKAAMIFEVDGKAQEESAKLFYDKLSSGEPLIVKKARESSNLNSTGEFKTHTLNVKQTFVADLLQDHKKTVWYEFYDLLGINNSNIDKKERVNTLEVKANIEALIIAVKEWNDNIKEDLERVKKLFPDLKEFNITMPFYDRLVKQLESEKEDEIDEQTTETY